MNTTLAKNGCLVKTLDELEIKWVKANLQLTNAELAKRFGITSNRMRLLMRRANIGRYKVNYWSDEDIQYLKENFNSSTEKELAQYFGRTKKAVSKKKRQYDLKLSEERKSDLGRKGQQCMSRPSNWKEEGAVWFLKNTGIWMTKQNGKNIHWRRWAYEKLHGPIPSSVKIFWNDGDNSKLDPTKLQLTPSRLKRSDYQKAKMYVLSTISRQSSRSTTWYIANGYGIEGCRFGSIWINESNTASKRMRDRIKAINDRWPRHWQKK